MPNLICIDTSTSVCSVCSGYEGGILHLSEIDRKNSHTETITLQIQECLQKAGWLFSDLDAIVVSDGPGSYTGLRVGTSAAKAIAYAMDIHLIGIPTLMALAEGVRKQCTKEDLIMPMIDARRMEVYTALYDFQLNKIRDTQAQIIDDGIFDGISVSGKIVLCGDGCFKVYEIKTPEFVHIYPTVCTAANLLPIALQYYEKEIYVNVAEYDPSYHKIPNVTKSKKNIF